MMLVNHILPPEENGQCKCFHETCADKKTLAMLFAEFGVDKYAAFKEPESYYSLSLQPHYGQCDGARDCATCLTNVSCAWDSAGDGRCFKHGPVPLISETAALTCPTQGLTYNSDNVFAGKIRAKKRGREQARFKLYDTNLDAAQFDCFQLCAADARYSVFAVMEKRNRFTCFCLGGNMARVKSKGDNYW